MNEKGLLFHAKHAFMPNSLGYCGPDDRGRILRSLEEGRGGEELQAVLSEFEAAYPFLGLISRSTGRDVFDYSVAEAYWIGNGLLDEVEVPEFYKFTHHELKGRDPAEVKMAFRELGRRSRPHHTFYVMSTYATSAVGDGPNITNTAARRLGELIDDCRVSWGRVTRVGEKELGVSYKPVVLREARLGFGREKTKRVLYNHEVSPFGSVKEGDWVSLHWNYACEVLTPGQVRNAEKYTRLDAEAINRLLVRRER